MSTIRPCVITLALVALIATDVFARGHSEKKHPDAAASELARNTLVYGGGGTVDVTRVDNGRRNGIQIVFADQGPGIVDLDLALTDGYTTGGGLGLGLSGARRLVDEFDIVTAVGQGTTITVTKWCR